MLPPDIEMPAGALDLVPFFILHIAAKDIETSEG
jgi:hypothetical protein